MLACGSGSGRTVVGGGRRHDAASDEGASWLFPSSARKSIEFRSCPLSPRTFVRSL